jgi:CrcB protein
MNRILLVIGIGGFLGSIARYLSQQYFQKYFPSSLPLGTLWVNLSGCFLIGVIYALAEKGNLLSPEWRLFLATGFCGGFTTFSAFAFENTSFLKEGDFFYAALYMGLSVIGGIVAAYLGTLFIRFL